MCCQLPLGEGYLEVVVHCLLQSVQRSTPEPLFVLSTCQLVMSVVTAATTWWLDVSAAGPAVLAYLHRVAPHVLEKAAKALVDDQQILFCIKAIMMKLDITLSERYKLDVSVISSNALFNTACRRNCSLLIIISCLLNHETFLHAHGDCTLFGNADSLKTVKILKPHSRDTGGDQPEV